MKICGEGIQQLMYSYLLQTLTAASYVFLVEPLLEPALETQAIARVHRIGQKKKTTVFQYMIPDTVDERIGLLSLRKWKHLIFSRAHSTGTVQEPSVATAPTQDRSSNANNSPARRSRYMDTQDKKVNIDGDALTNEDLAMLLLDKEGPVALRNALARVAELKKEHQEAVVRERQERAQLSWEIMRAVAEDPTAANDWEGWDIGLD